MSRQRDLYLCFSSCFYAGPESEHVECLAVLGEAPDMLPLVNKYLKQYIPYNKAGVLTWQSGVEANIAVFEAVQGLPPRPHPQEEWIQRLLPLIKVFQSVESFSVSYRCLNDVWTEKEDYEVRAADGTLLMAWRDPSYQERRKLAEKRAKDQGLVKKCYTGVSKRSSDKKRSAKANVWVGKVMHQKREFVKDFSDVHRAAKFRDLCVLMVGKDLNGFDLNFPKVDYEDEEFRNEGLSTPLEWSERRGDGYTWWSRLAER